MTTLIWTSIYDTTTIHPIPYNLATYSRQIVEENAKWIEELPFHGEVEAVSGVLDRGDNLRVVALEDVHSLHADEKIADLETRIICRRTSNHRANLQE